MDVRYAKEYSVSEDEYGPITKWALCKLGHFDRGMGSSLKFDWPQLCNPLTYRDSQCLFWKIWISYVDIFSDQEIRFDEKIIYVKFIWNNPKLPIFLENK